MNRRLRILHFSFLDDIDGKFWLGWFGGRGSPHGTDPLWKLFRLSWCRVHEPVHRPLVRHICPRVRSSESDSCDAASENYHHLGRKTEQILQVEVFSFHVTGMLSTGMFTTLQPEKSLKKVTMEFLLNRHLIYNEKSSKNTKPFKKLVEYQHNK